MPDDYTIPMQGPAAQIPEQRIQHADAKIPMSGESAPVIDPMANEQKATALAMQQSQLKEQQGQQQIQEQEQSDMAKDRTKLQAYTDSGGNLHTEEGIKEALKEGGWSQKTVAGLLARQEAIQKNSIEFQKALRGEDEVKVKQMHDVMQETLKRASVPSDKYEQALADKKDPTEAAKIFNEEIQALMTEERANLDPVTGKPRIGEEKLAEMAKMSPQRWKEIIKEGDYKVKQVALNLATRKTEADIKEKENKAKKEAADAERIAKSGPIGERATMGGGELSAADKNLIDTDAERFLNGAPLTSIAKGLGKSATQYMNTIKQAGINKLIEQGKTPKEIADFIDKASIMYKAESGAYGALEKVSTGQVKIGEKLKLDMESLKDRLPKGDANSVKIMNTPINKLRSAFSSEDYAPFRLQAELLGNEFERQMVGNGLSIAQLPVAAQENAHKVMNGDMSAGEILAIMPQMLIDMDNVAKANVAAKKASLSRFDTKKKDATTSGEKGAGYTTTPKGETSSDTKEILQKELVKAQEQVTTAKTPEEKHRAEIDVEDLQRDLKRKGISVAPKAAAPKLSGKDAEAVSWAKANPNDPRSKQILSLHGM